MNCKNCLMEIEDESLFCNKCGHIIPFKKYSNLETKVECLAVAKSVKVANIK